jgi:hypothetical protein
MRQQHYLTTLLAVTFMFGSSSILAAACRVTNGVTNSTASIAANTGAGGHVSMHIKGNATEATKSQFNTFADFTTSWNNWVSYAGHAGPNPKVCGGSGGSQMDCVSANIAGINAAYVCDTVAANGSCTVGHNIVPVAVAFRYAQSNGVWMLNTAYPSVNLNCQ